MLLDGCRSMNLNGFDEDSSYFLLLNFVVENLLQLLHIPIRGLTMILWTITRTIRLNGRISAVLAAPDAAVRIGIHRHSTSWQIPSFESKHSDKHRSWNDELLLPSYVRQRQRRLNNSMVGVSERDRDRSSEQGLLSLSSHLSVITSWSLVYSLARCNARSFASEPLLTKRHT
jgi:hypothetical protein